MRSIISWAAMSAVAAGLLAACSRPADKPPAAAGQDMVSVDVAAAAKALGAPAAPSVRAAYEGEFEAVGSEPFWRLDLLADWAAFVRPGLPEIGALPGPRDVREQGALISAGPLLITLRAGACVHESGETFPYSARVDFEGVAYEGCARRAAGGAGDAAGWTSGLAALMPAIDACLQRIEKPPGRVTIAYLMDDGQAGVRLLDDEGGRFECNVAADGSKVGYWGAIGDRDVLQGEREPLFTRAPTPAPEGKCFSSEAALGVDGTALGWRTRRVC